MALLEQTATGRLATARLSSVTGDHDDAVLDLLFASSGIEPEVVGAAESVELFPKLQVPVAQVGHLIALKVLARDDDTRPQDLFDLRALIAEASMLDLATATDSLTLIAERGYDRGKDLRAGFDALLNRLRPNG